MAVKSPDNGDAVPVERRRQDMEDRIRPLVGATHAQAAIGVPAMTVKPAGRWMSRSIGASALTMQSKSRSRLCSTTCVATRIAGCLRGPSRPNRSRTRFSMPSRSRAVKRAWNRSRSMPSRPSLRNQS